MATNIYRFFLNGGTVRPLFGENQAKEATQYQDEKFFRYLFTEGFTLLKDDYNAVAAQSVETEFVFDVQRLVSTNPNTWETYYKGYFTKFDCEIIDEDNEIIRFKPLANDIYRRILEGYDREFNITKLGIEKTTIRYKKYPILQIYITEFGLGRFCYFSAGQVYQSSLNEVVNQLTLTNEGFQLVNPNNGVLGHVSGQGNTDDVSGKYLDDIHENGLYKVIRDTSDDFKHKVIRIADDAEMYVQAEPSDDFIKTMVATNGSGETVQYTKATIWARVLVNSDSLPNINTIPVDEEWTVPTNEQGYVVTNMTIPESVVEMTSNFSTTQTIYGRIAEPAANNIGDYYQVSTPVEQTHPVMTKEWGDVSIWLNITSFLTATLNLAIETIVLRDAYRLDRVIGAIIQELNSSVTHDNWNLSNSFFLYKDNNPLTGLAQGEIYVTAKTNIIVSNYDEAANNVPVKLKELLRALRIIYFGLYWHISETNRFRLEHNYYYERGGAYFSGEVVGANLTTLQSVQSGLSWSYDTNKTKLEKAEIPGRIFPKWSDESSDLFKGQAVEVNSSQANKERTNDPSVPLVYTDLNYINTNPGGVRRDGLVMLETEVIDGQLWVKEVSIQDAQNGPTANIQNGNLSFTQLAENYAKFNAPATSITVNGVDITAESVTRQKVQNTSLVVPYEVDPIKLVRTSVGKGKPTKVSHVLMSDETKFTLKHKTE